MRLAPGEIEQAFEAYLDREDIRRWVPLEEIEMLREAWMTSAAWMVQSDILTRDNPPLEAIVTEIQPYLWSNENEHQHTETRP